MKQLLVDLGPKLYMNCVPNGIIMEQFQPSMIDEDFQLCENFLEKFVIVLLTSSFNFDISKTSRFPMKNKIESDKKTKI